MTVKHKLTKSGASVAKAMPAKRRLVTKGVKSRAGVATSNAYVQALLHNKKVHSRLGQGLTSARVVYLRGTRRGDSADALLDDRKSRRELRRMIASLREAAATVRGAKARKQRGAAVRAAAPIVVVVGGAGALAANAGVREKVIGMVSGSNDARDESEVSPPTQTRPTA
ncbi:MAG: hypothetical protein M3P50_05910 [Actinomycetota bacterium]|nr:hypothetical protein [Actinomycetota bacterium]